MATKKAMKAAPKKSARKSAEPAKLSKQQVAALRVLAASKRALSRADLAAKTEIRKGWSRCLGAPNRDGGKYGATSLESLKLVTRDTDERGRFVYAVTDAGRAALKAVQQ